MANYIDPKKYHEEMVRCKKSGQLTDRAIEFFQLQAREVSKVFYFEDNEDRKDAIANAVKDFVCYWKNFKENSVVQIKIIRNFVAGEKFKIDVWGDKSYTYTASVDPKTDFEFLIGTTENKSLDNLHAAVQKTIADKMHSSLHKVTRKINLMDNLNGDDKEKQSVLTIELVDPRILVKDEKVYTKVKEYKFETPPDSFKFFTSMARNGIIKYINEHHPEEVRDGKLVHFSRINSEDGKNGFFNV